LAPAATGKVVFMRVKKLVIAATALVASRSLLYFAAVPAPYYLLGNSKIVRLAGIAKVSNHRPLACCATGQASLS